MTARLPILTSAASLLSSTATFAGGYVAAPILDVPPLSAPTASAAPDAWWLVVPLLIVAVLIGKGKHGRGGTPKGDGGSCFLEGTLIRTPYGWQPVETIRPGDWIDTTAGTQRVVHVSSWTPTEHCDRPVIIDGVHLSPNHRVKVGDKFAPAIDISDKRGKIDGRSYYHILLVDHALLRAKGDDDTSFVWAESLALTPDMALGRLMPDLAAHHAECSEVAK